ncbi:MAG: hypothetical protein KF724_12920, partial [Phycisphaeraceae bacterium]|nr:hypothetical protein [Phycisphaeraceae bacterium]
IGWDGYVFNPATGDYLVRHRTYRPTLGRWGERDPAGYMDSASLVLYALARPVSLWDPFGLAVRTPEIGTFRSDLQMCLRALCPSATVDGSGNITVPPAGDDLYTPPKGPTRTPPCNSDCGAVNCDSPPGCEILRQLIAKSALAIRNWEHFPKDRLNDRMPTDFYEPGTPGTETDFYGNKLTRPIPAVGQSVWWKRQGFSEGGCRLSKCEVLWHELVHAWRDANGLLNTLPGGQQSHSVRSAAEAWEEIQTISYLNDTLNPWYNCCVVGRDDSKRVGGCWSWRDPRGHGYVSKAIRAGHIRDDEVPKRPQPARKRQGTE